MRFDWWTLALQTVNFAVLVWLLHRFLYRPVLAMVDRRRAEIEDQRAAVARLATEAKARQDGLEHERAQIAADRDAALEAAAAEAERHAAARAARAEQEAAVVLERTRRTLAAEREAALAEARRIALDLGADIARRMMAELPAAVRADAWLDRIARRLADLTPAERAALHDQLTGGAAVVVATAATLPADAEAAWRIRLQSAVGAEIAIAFETDPALVAGAELRFPNTVVGLSWQDAITAVRSEIGADADAR